MSHVPIPPVRLHNIKDAAAFTVKALERSGIAYDEHEREDLISEGMAILCTMAAEWAPERHGDGTGSFLGYAHVYLPYKLLDAWHKSHPEHSYVKQPDGSRAYAYGRPAESLYDDDGNPRDVVATAYAFDHVEAQDGIESVLRLIPAEYRIVARPVVNGTLEGLPPHEIARRSHMTTADVHLVRSAIGSAMYQTQTLEAA